MLYGDAISRAGQLQKLLDSERDFTVELVKVLVQAAVTGRVR